MPGLSSTEPISQLQSKRQRRKAASEARRRHQRRFDMALMGLAALTAVVLALGFYGQQQKLNRATAQLEKLQALEKGSKSSNAPVGLAGGVAGTVSTAVTSPVSLTQGMSDGAAAPAPKYPIAGIAEAAAEAGDCPKAASTQLAFKRQFLAPIRYWSQTELGRLRSQRVTYLFSGPDVATAAALFDTSRHMVLVADQWVERLDSAQATEARQKAECHTLSHYSRYGYFRTHDLEGQRGGARPRFLHLLLHNIALADLRVVEAEYLRMSPAGEPVPVPETQEAKPSGVRFHAQRPDGSKVLIDYLRIDLSDHALQRSAAEAAFLRKSLGEVVLLKSASHLLQEPSFSVVGGMVSERARAVVQDETGMPINALRNNFDLRLFGDFAEAHRLWTGKAAVQQLKEYRASVRTAEPLFFTFGYEKPVGSLILVGTRRKDAIKVAQNP